MSSKDEEKVPDTESGLRPRSADDARPFVRTYRAGDVIAGRYRLGKRLGAGGMGEVWLSHNDTLDIDVAIKLIRAGDRSSAATADRLLTEARAAARLGHPAIVRINDFGTTERGDPFIVMELLDGETLGRALANRGRLSAVKAVRTILPIAHALTVAHTKGIVHRDLKPENIFLAQTDDANLQPKLLDFGVAKLEAQSPAKGTPAGALFGSPLYMAPEQARGDDVDHRADIWALGVVLYELITGRPPFEGKNYNAVLYSIVANPATPIMDLGAGDEELWAVIERALQKDPDRRWYSMRDFGEALATWLSDRNVHEDITGTSLQTTWLSWHKDGTDRLESAPPGAGSKEDGVAAFPPPPNLPNVGRARIETVRKRRPRVSPAGYVAFALSLVLVAYLIGRALIQDEVVVEGASVPSTAAVAAPPKAEVAPVSKPLPPPSPAVDEAEPLPEDPAVAPSSLPIAGEEAPSGEPAKALQPRSRPKATQTAGPPPNRGIVDKDPYGGKLKDPFE